jgi:hypothetical protein
MGGKVEETCEGHTDFIITTGNFSSELTRGCHHGRNGILAAAITVSALRRRLGGFGM